jgi:hypothetical protein
MLVVGIETLPKFQHMLNDRQMRQKYSGMRYRTDRVKGGTEEVKSEKQSTSGRNDSEGLALRVSAQPGSLSWVVSLSSFEAMLVNSQGRDLRLKRLPRESELGSGTSRARDLAPAIRQRGLNDVLFMLGKCGA